MPPGPDDKSLARLVPPPILVEGEKEVMALPRARADGPSAPAVDGEIATVRIPRLDLWGIVELAE